MIRISIVRGLYGEGWKAVNADTGEPVTGLYSFRCDVLAELSRRGYAQTPPTI